MPNFNQHTPERAPSEKMIDYRLRRRESAQLAREQSTGGELNAKNEWVSAKRSSNGGHRGTRMAFIRAARKARNRRAR